MYYSENSLLVFFFSQFYFFHFTPLQKIVFNSSQVFMNLFCLVQNISTFIPVINRSIVIFSYFLLFRPQATEKVVKKKKEATEKSTEVEQNRKQITVEQEEAEEALRKALPDLENARAALDTLKKKDITEVRSFANPPEPVQIICECVAILKGFKDISWKTAKGMLADTSFLKSLQEMNCDLITVKQVTSCRAHMKVC